MLPHHAPARCITLSDSPYSQSALPCTCLILIGSAHPPPLLCPAEEEKAHSSSTGIPESDNMLLCFSCTGAPRRGGPSWTAGTERLGRAKITFLLS